MTKDRVRQLVPLLPDQNKYAGIDRCDIPSRYRSAHNVTLLAQACADPAFGWTLVHAYFSEDRSLPACVTEPELWRAHCYVARNSLDDEVQQALQLCTKAERWRKVIIQCMLLIPSYTGERIAGEMQMPVASVKIYAELFWNVRDRLHDEPYIGNIIYPETRQITWAQDYHLLEFPERLALRAAYDHGEPGILIAKRFLGMAPIDTKQDAAANAKALEAQIMAHAKHMADMGFVHQSNVAAIAAGRMLIQSSKIGGEQQKSTDDLVGLGRLGMSGRVLDHFQKFMDNQTQHQLQKQQIEVANRLREKLAASSPSLSSS